MTSSSSPKGQMRALRANKQSERPRLERVDIPEVGPQDVLIKVASAGLVPGNMAMLKIGRLTTLPTTLGHNVAGIVEKIGELVDTVEVGERVRLHPNLSCGTCNYLHHRPGSDVPRKWSHWLSKLLLASWASVREISRRRPY